MLKLQNFLQKIVLIVLGCYVAYSLYWCFFTLPYAYVWKEGGASVATLLVGLVILGITILWLGYRRLCNDNMRIPLQYILWGVILILQVIWLGIVWEGNATPRTDLANNTDEAIKMLESGTFAQYSSVSFYPYQRTHILLLYFFYKILDVVGIGAYWKASIMLSMLCMDVALYFSAKIVKHLWGSRGEYLFLMICVGNPVVYLCLPYYYTSITALPFMMAALYFLIRLIQEEDRRKGILCGVAAGITSIMGYNIRVTASFPLIATVVYLIFTWKRKTIQKKCIAKYASLIVSAGIMVFVWNGIISHYDSFDRTEKSLGVETFVLIGMQGNGGYLQSDFDYAANFDTKEERIQACLNVIKERVNKMGLPGFLTLIGGKIKYNWSRGDAGFSYWYPSSWSYISAERRDFLILYSQAYRIIIWLFVLVNIMIRLQQRIKNEGLIVLIALFGGFVIRTFMEANPQYSVIFLLIMTIAAVDGIFLLKNAWQGKAIITSTGITRFLGKASLLACVLLAVGFIKWYPNFVEYEREYTEIASEQEYFSSRVWENGFSGNGVSLVAEDDLTIKQTFKTDKPFNTVRLRVIGLKESVNNTYIISLKQNKKLIYQQEFGSADIDSSGEYVVFNVSRVIPEKLTNYSIVIQSTGKQKEDSLSFRIENRELDYAPNGEFIVDGEKWGNVDLTYMVGDTCNRAIYNKTQYLLITSMIVVFGMLVGLRGCRDE